MKRICSLILAFCMCLAAMPAFAAKSDFDSAVFEVTSLGVFEGDQSGDLKLENTLTRAEFAKIVVVLSGHKDLIAGGVSPMKDVPADHWASGYIKYLVDAGMMSGYPDGTFRPNATISLDECMKTILVIMGYELVANERGGYPDGYYSVAIEKKLLENVSIARKDAALRKDVVMMIYNALDVPNLVINYSTNPFYYEDSNTTIRKAILKIDDLDSYTGVVTATTDVWLNAPNSSMRENQIEIDGLLYDVNPAIMDAAKKHIGQRVVAYYKQDKTMPYPLIHNIQPTIANEVNTLPAEETSFSSGEITYRDPETGRKTIFKPTGETKYIYNGRPETRLTEAFKNIQRGSYVIVDNDHDNAPEYVFAHEYKNYVVEKINPSGSITMKYMGDDNGETKVLHKNLILELEETNDYTIKDASGRAISYEQIEENMVISLYENNNDNFKKIIISEREPFISTVTAKDSDGNKVYIGDEAYIMDSEEMCNWVKIGRYYKFYPDAEGRIAYVDEDLGEEEVDVNSEPIKKDMWRFGYIHNIDNVGLSGRQVAMIDAGKVINRAEQNLEDRTDTSAIPVTLCQNNAVLSLSVADRVNVDGRNIKAGDIASVAGQPIRYLLDEEGALKKIETLEEIGGSVATKYNAKEKVFGTVNVLEQRPFMIDKDTQVICIPSNADASVEDMLVQLSIDNKDQFMEYNAFGYEADEETNAAKLLVITRKMDASEIKAVTPSDAKVALVVASNVLVDDYDEYVKLTIATGGEVKDINTLPMSQRPALRNLKDGDIIFYIEDANGCLENATIVNNVRNAINGEVGTTSSDYLQRIGYVQDIRMNQIDNIQRIRINQIDLVTVDGLISNINVPISNYPDVFIYDMEDKIATIGTIEDIISYETPVAYPEKIVILYSGDTIRSIIIMR